jgi:hypothetical protein
VSVALAPGRKRQEGIVFLICLILSKICRQRDLNQAHYPKSASSNASSYTLQRQNVAISSDRQPQQPVLRQPPPTAGSCNCGQLQVSCHRRIRFRQSRRTRGVSGRSMLNETGMVTGPRRCRVSLWRCRVSLRELDLLPPGWHAVSVTTEPEQKTARSTPFQRLTAGFQDLASRNSACL